jgi:hypothetical protein
VPNPCAQNAFPLPLYPCPEIETILGRTLVFHFTFPLLKDLLCRGLPPRRATAFGILKLAGSSSHLPGPLASLLPSSQLIAQQFLEFEPDRDLRSMQGQLIEEISVAKVIIEISITNLRKDVAGDLTA